MNSAERPREYVKGVSSEGRTTLTFQYSVGELPFTVWKSVGRLAGKSSNDGGTTTFEFLDDKYLPEALEILKGAMFTEVAVFSSSNYLTLIRQSTTHLQLAYDFAQKNARGKKDALMLVEAAERKLQHAKKSLKEAIEKGD